MKDGWIVGGGMGGWLAGFRRVNKWASMACVDLLKSLPSGPRVSGFLLSFLHNHLLHSVPHLAPGFHWRQRRTWGMARWVTFQQLSKWYCCWGTDPITHTAKAQWTHAKEALFSLSDWFFWPLYIRWSHCALALLLKCGQQTSSMGNTRKLVRNAESESAF